MSALVEKWRPVLDKLPNDIKNADGFVRLLESEYRFADELEDFTRFILPMCTEVWRKLEKSGVKIEVQESDSGCVLEEYGPAVSIDELSNKFRTVEEITEYLSKCLAESIVSLVGNKTFKPYLLFIPKDEPSSTETPSKFVMQHNRG